MSHLPWSLIPWKLCNVLKSLCVKEFDVKDEKHFCFNFMIFLEFKFCHINVSSSSFYSSSSLNFVLIFMAHVIAHFKQLIPFTVRINFTPSMVFAHKPFKNTISTWYGFILERFKANCVHILSQITLDLKANDMVVHNKILS